MKQTLLAILLLVPSISVAGSFPGGSASFVEEPSWRVRPQNPNIIFVMLDDVGREAYPQLGAFWQIDPLVASFTGSVVHSDNFYKPQLAGDFPSLNRLLDNGINFTGVWSGDWCKMTRDMLRWGWDGVGEDPTRPPWHGDGNPTTKDYVQSLTGSAYKIGHHGKNMMGAMDGTDNDLATWGSTGLIMQDSLGHGGFGWVSSSATWTMPRSDSELWTVDGNEYMHVDEVGFLELEDWVETFYGNAPLNSVNWFGHRTGQPFFLTISTGLSHGFGGINCVHNRTPTNGYATGPADAILDITPANGHTVIPVLAPVGRAAEPYGPDTPNYTASEFAALLPAASGGPGTDFDWVKLRYDCELTHLTLIDEQIGKLLDWLGPEGLENTFIIFTGDNGSEDKSLPYRQNIVVPVSANSADQPTSCQWDVNANTCSPAHSWITNRYAGKGGPSETGLNVPFVVSYGSIPQNLRGTSSAARFNFADVAETTLQLIRERPTTYFDRGRDFSSLLDGTAVSQNRLLGATIGTDWARVTSFVPGTSQPISNDPLTFSVVLDPDASGDAYRVWRWPDEDSSHCDYVQNISDPATWHVNLRNSAVQEVIDARAEINLVIEAAYPNMYPENVACLPQP